MNPETIPYAYVDIAIWFLNIPSVNYWYTEPKALILNGREAKNRLSLVMIKKMNIIAVAN